jgi:hypothetical protein
MEWYVTGRINTWSGRRRGRERILGEQAMGVAYRVGRCLRMRVGVCLGRSLRRWSLSLLLRGFMTRSRRIHPRIHRLWACGGELGCRY